MSKQKLHVKIGDNVTIISGSEKNKSGEIVKI
jgi:ribosomal protein L24